MGLQHGRGALHAGGAHRLLGMIAEEAGDVEAAEQHYATALSLLEQTGAAGDIADICRLFGDLMRSEGRTEEALNAYRTGLGHRAGPGTTTLGPRPRPAAVRPLDLTAAGHRGDLHCGPTPSAGWGAGA